MIDSHLAAEYFIIRAYQEGRESDMTNMKVQKLLYYAQSLHLALYDAPLFAEEIQAWRYGPVCPSAYHYYSEFEAEQLPIPDKPEGANLSEENLALLEEVWEYFGEYHANQLSGMTHLEFPWQKARHGLPAVARSTEPILLEDMKVLGLEKLDQIERENPVYQDQLSQVIERVKTATPSRRRLQKEEIGDWLESLLA